MTLTEETPVDTIRESAPPNSSLTQLFSGIISDAQLLFKQQVELIRAEFIEDLKRTKQVAQCYGLGALLMTVGSVMLLVASVYLLESMTHWPLGACWAAIGAASLLFGGLSMFAGSRIWQSYNPLPDKSFKALQENASCLTNQPK